MFESLVNTEGFQTDDIRHCLKLGLRVLLIRKDFKQQSGVLSYLQEFESLVNTEGFQTKKPICNSIRMFESLVNTEGFQTRFLVDVLQPVFESLVNTEGFQTVYQCQ